MGDDGPREGGRIPRDARADGADVLAETWPADQRWAVLHARPRCEKKLVHFCGQREVPVYLPLRRRPHQYGARKRVFWTPLFPGYVFCRPTAQARSTLRQNHYVARVLDVPDQAQMVGQLRQIRQALAVDDLVEVQPYLAAGRRVRVIAGPFKDLEGIVQRVKGHTKVVINVDMIQQAVCVEVDGDWLGPA